MSQSINDMVNRDTRDVHDEVKGVVLNLEKNFGEGWKPAEQSCVIYSIAYDSDHLVIKSFRINGSG